MEYIVDDKALDARAFLALAGAVWPGDYDEAKTARALQRTINITARERAASWAVCAS